THIGLWKRKIEMQTALSGGGSLIDIPGVTWTLTPTATTKASRKTHASEQLAPAASNLSMRL
ncbi:unnamed protein product, partial [Heterotrigona itama]